MKLFLFVIVLSLLFANGCTKKPKLQELQQLEEQRRTIDEQEKKLKELQAEREKFDLLLEKKKVELKALESERDSLKNKLGK